MSVVVSSPVVVASPILAVAVVSSLVVVASSSAVEVVVSSLVVVASPSAVEVVVSSPKFAARFLMIKRICFISKGISSFVVVVSPPVGDSALVLSAPGVAVAVVCDNVVAPAGVPISTTAVDPSPVILFPKLLLVLL